MSHALNAAALRDYDIRGVYSLTLDERDAWAIGRSFATRVRRAGGQRVAVGRDGRNSSPALEAALVEGLRASGVDVVRIGLGPSPMLYFAEATLAVEGGVQVTASHNPAEHNGFKLVLQHRSFWGDDIADLARLAAAGDWEQGAGDCTETDLVDAYADRLLAGRERTLPALRIGWDCGNGAAGPVVESLIERLPGEHHLLFADVDGDFPNHHPDPTREPNLSALRALVADKRLHFGIAFDGDGDRIGAIDGSGRMLRGDHILAILAAPVLAVRPGAPIVADVKASRHLFARIAALGGRPVMARTGHSPMKAALIETGAPLAGEMSGHMFFADDWYGFDDALYAAVRLIEAVGVDGSLGALRDAMGAGVMLDERRIPVAAADKRAIVADVIERLRAEGKAVDITDGARVTCAEGWWLLRASNTEDALTVQAEADDAAGLERLIAAIGRALAPAALAVPDGH